MAKTNNARTVQFTAGTTTTVTVFKTTAGTSHVLQSVTAAAHSLWGTQGQNSVSNVTIDHSQAGGSADWQAFTTNGNADAGSNVGWHFTPPDTLFGAAAM
jgi:hypothetical protein